MIEQLEELQATEGKKYSRELQQLTQAEAAMDDAVGLLGIPDAGPPTVAAETEAIEALLRTSRAGGKGGGGGGNSPGGGGGGEKTEALASALARLGEGTAAQSRLVRQATGRDLGNIPEEYRRGIDAYFNALEEEVQR